MSGKVYAVASGKGGVGKTTTVVNLGVTLRADNHSVVLVDADLGMANLGTFLGMEQEPTLHDVLAGEATLDEALTEQADRFAILPGSRDLRQYATADPGGLGDVLEELADRYEYVLVDTGAGVGFEDVLPLELVDEVVLVSAPDRAALGDAAKTAEISELLDAPVRGLVLTMVDETDDPAAIADGLGVDLLAAIPEDPAVPESTAAGRPLEASAPESAAAAGYRELAAALTGRDVARYEPPEATEGAASGEEDGEAADETADDAPGPAGEVDESDVETDESTGEADAAPESTAQPAESDEEAGSPTQSPEEASREETDAGGDERDEEEGADDAHPEAAAEGDADTEPADTGDETPDEDRTPETESEEPEDEGEAETADDERSGGLLSRLGGLFG